MTAHNVRLKKMEEMNMKAEIGKYARTRYGKIYKITVLDSYTDIVVVKVADTPQELVQAGDAIEIYDKQENKYSKLFINKLKKHNEHYTEYWYDSFLDDEISCIDVFTPQENSYFIITKILTPNSSGGYDLQYSKEEK